MSRRMLALLLVPALVGTMVGVGLATDRLGLSASAPHRIVPVGQADGAGDAPAAAPTRSPAPEQTDELHPEPTAQPAGEVAGEAGDSDGPPAPAYDVGAVQQQLTELRYYVGAIDGEEGPATRSAVMAFQKVNGLGADGIVGPATLAALADPTVPSLRGGTGTRIEVDLTKQVLYFVKGGELARVLPVSSGSGETYRTAGGGTARSLTPTGTYKIERRIRGERHAALGTLYDPLYFYRGWAIHGSNSVPAHPASHGCVRITRADAIWLFDRVPVGTTVMLYGGTHTFVAGSDAAGTDAPAGDTGTDPTRPAEQSATQPPASAPPAAPDQQPPAPQPPAPQQPAPQQPAPQQPAPQEPPPQEPTAPAPRTPSPQPAQPSGPPASAPGADDPQSPQTPAGDSAGGDPAGAAAATGQRSEAPAP